MKGAEATRFHRCVPGEIVVADASVVLEMALDDTTGLIMYDRSLRLAAATQVDLSKPTPGKGDAHGCVDAAAVALLVRLLDQGCTPAALEIFLLGTGRPVGSVGWPSPSASEWFFRDNVSVAYAALASSRARRVEFDVEMGRLVVEEARAPEAVGKALL